LVFSIIKVEGEDDWRKDGMEMSDCNSSSDFYRFIIVSLLERRILCGKVVSSDWLSSESV
jgi:hypothetical protein